MRADILKKLETLLTKGITSEAEVVYLMSAVRKLLEQQQAKKQYGYPQRGVATSTLIEKRAWHDTADSRLTALLLR